MHLSNKPLISQETLAHIAARLGASISKEYASQSLVMLPVLKGSIVFAADLIRHIQGVDLTIEFIRARSYSGKDSTGEVHFSQWPDTPLRGKRLLVVEDILDTGATTSALIQRLEAEEPDDIKFCTLLDKPSRREHPIRAHFIGCTIPDEFVVGYGLDYDERYRELPAIYTLLED